MNTRRAALATLGGSLLCPAAIAAAPSEPSLRLSLPASKSRKDRRYLRLKGFHLLFTNTSADPVAVWRDWCSWGWFCPHLTIVLGGKSYDFKRAERDWTKNYPDAFWILPGEHYILPIRLLGDEWVQPADFQPDFDTPAKVTCTFTIPEDGATQEQGVWTGTLKVTQTLNLDAASEANPPF